MKSVSLRLSEQLFSQGSDIAKKLGISRMAFFRQAIEHEIERIQKNQELDAMKASLDAIKSNPDYWEHQAEWQDTEERIPPSDKIWSMTILQQGGVYLARLDLVKGAEIGKLRPVTILTNQQLLDVDPVLIFVCPLSRHSQPQFSALHVLIKARERLLKNSYALVEHCRSLAASRIKKDQLATLSSAQLLAIIHRLERMIEP
jgi:mRNA interferase MazF